MRLDGIGLRHGRRGPWLLRDVQLELLPGQLIRAQGRNGCGKSTLLRVVAGAARPGRGQVLGRPARTAYVPERFPPALPFPALEYLRLMGRVHGLPAAEAERRGTRLLSRLGAEGHADRPLARLSKGTCQKVAVAQALLADPALLVLDEAWTGLDTDARTALDEEVEERADRGTTVVFVDHDPSRLGLRTDLRWALGDGTVAVTSQEAATPVRIDCTGVADGPEALSALPGVRAVTVLADATVRLETDEAHSDALLRALLALPGTHVRRVSGGLR
ncbi:ABC transporter ATP-binding protein [Streptomyces liangshanensis]|uniref:ATP-binding cassette domain-containing protein n=1 Tax=Streptomyces liangshanensis TaxID=2717324 RepID=A0A6G9H6M9_9ACTN|nr:ATP-binding cassette domain-containing protein [Streptomyces liangshanensis]QIQ06150.1 ATP-binding cassette domain-containing protein [Streptomyces liangshanensis]